MSLIGEYEDHGGWLALPLFLLDNQVALGLCSEKLNYVEHILKFRRENKRIPFCSIETMASLTGWSCRKVSRVRASLVDNGDIKLIYRRKLPPLHDLQPLLDRAIKLMPKVEAITDDMPTYREVPDTEIAEVHQSWTKLSGTTGPLSPKEREVFWRHLTTNSPEEVTNGINRLYSNWNEYKNYAPKKVLKPTIELLRLAFDPLLTPNQTSELIQ